MNTTIWLSTLSAALVFISAALGLFLRFVLANKDTIVQVIQAVREIRQRVDEHDDATGLNPVRKGYTDLPGPKPAAIAPINPAPALSQSKIQTVKLSP